MYAKTDLFERQQAKDERKRHETKKELKSLLTKFIGPDRAKYAVQNAQHKMGVMHERMDKATQEMRKINKECKSFIIFTLVSFSDPMFLNQSPRRENQSASSKTTKRSTTSTQQTSRSSS